MVRRLVRSFLNWLRQILARLKGKKPRRHLPSQVHRLPSSSQQELFQSIEEHDVVAQSLEKKREPAKSLQQQPGSLSQTPTLASIAESNPSNFEILLSNYQYSPNSVVRNLNHQLLTNPNQPSCPSLPNLNPEATPVIKTREHRDSPNPTTKTPSINADVELDNETAANLKNQRLQPISKVLDSAPDIITKQGVVKLLFKLKKNNHHGYITPNDGSKDIIFHQKYIGDDVFCQLERGMKVEVTAHVTEGKAYADHIRIL